MDCKSTGAALHAYLDRELDPTTHGAVESHLQSCAACRSLLGRYESLGAAVKQHAADKFAPPEHLLTRVESALAVARFRPPQTAYVQAPARSWWLTAAAALFVAVAFSSLLTLLISERVRDQRAADEAIAEEASSGHIRSRLADHLAGISSSDASTVAAWFAGKLDFDLSLPDLGAHRFELIGGRLDYMYDQRVAVVMYRRGAHDISLFIWPATGSSEAGVLRLADDHLRILLWRRAGLNYCSVSELDEQQLREFAKANGAS
jgi:anti-sigma factor RsiW